MLDLFDSLEPKTLAARGEATSLEAAEELKRSGRLNQQCRQVLEALRGTPGATSAELARFAGLDRHLVARRLPDLDRLRLVQRGEARLCMATGRRAITWSVRAP